MRVFGRLRLINTVFNSVAWNTVGILMRVFGRLRQKIFPGFADGRGVGILMRVFGRLRLCAFHQMNFYAVHAGVGILMRVFGRLRLFADFRYSRGAVALEF